jgi:hypothetical protein
MTVFAAGIVPEWPTLVRLLGSVLWVLGIGLCLLVLVAPRAHLSQGRQVRLGFVTLPSLRVTSWRRSPGC